MLDFEHGYMLHKFSLRIKSKIYGSKSCLHLLYLSQKNNKKITGQILPLPSEMKKRTQRTSIR